MTARLAPVRLLATAFFLIAATAAAHPAFKIVRTARGEIFYSDLENIWRIDAAGRKSIALPGVHAHELALDAQGSVIGEDSDYLGGDRYRHRVWRLDDRGRVSDVVPWRNGFWRSYGLVRDRSGAAYWVECPEQRCVVRKRGQDGRVATVIASRQLGPRVYSMASAPDGSLYVIDRETLLRLRPDGTLVTLAASLGTYPMGMWGEAAGVLVAVYSRREVVRVDHAGRVTTVIRTPAPWGPTGVTVAPDGTLWILEYSDRNAARVRKVERNGRVTVY